MDGSLKSWRHLFIVYIFFILFLHVSSTANQRQKRHYNENENLNRVSHVLRVFGFVQRLLRFWNEVSIIISLAWNIILSYDATDLHNNTYKTTKGAAIALKMKLIEFCMNNNNLIVMELGSCEIRFGAYESLFY